MKAKHGLNVAATPHCNMVARRLVVDPPETEPIGASGILRRGPRRDKLRRGVAATPSPRRLPNPCANSEGIVFRKAEVVTPLTAGFSEP